MKRLCGASKFTATKYQRTSAWSEATLHSKFPISVAPNRFEAQYEREAGRTTMLRPGAELDTGTRADGWPGGAGGHPYLSCAGGVSPPAQSRIGIMAGAEPSASAARWRRMLGGGKRLATALPTPLNIAFSRSRAGVCDATGDTIEPIKVSSTGMRRTGCEAALAGGVSRTACSDQGITCSVDLTTLCRPTDCAQLATMHAPAWQRSRRLARRP